MEDIQVTHNLEETHWEWGQERNTSSFDISCFLLFFCLLLYKTNQTEIKKTMSSIVDAVQLLSI